MAAPKGTRELRPLTDYCLLLAPPENCVINAIVDVMLSLGVELVGVTYRLKLRLGLFKRLREYPILEPIL